MDALSFHGLGLGFTVLGWMVGDCAGRFRDRWPRAAARLHGSLSGMVRHEVGPAQRNAKHLNTSVVRTRRYLTGREVENRVPPDYASIGVIVAVLLAALIWFLWFARDLAMYFAAGLIRLPPVF